jgi:diadenosine tetraphosphatase ApaH/serine/threonine PP2A family protein phosphatase
MERDGFMFQPEILERDGYGFCFHSALNRSKEEDITKIDGAEDMEFHFVSFEEDATDELLKKYQGDPLTNEDWPDAVKAWQPTPPSGDGWFLFAIYDTEDGPYACFTRPKQSVAAVA